jgi:hypothetical protein
MHTNFRYAGVLTDGIDERLFADGSARSRSRAGVVEPQSVRLDVEGIDDSHRARRQDNTFDDNGGAKYMRASNKISRHSGRNGSTDRGGTLRQRKRRTTISGKSLRTDRCNRSPPVVSSPQSLSGHVRYFSQGLDPPPKNSSKDRESFARESSEINERERDNAKENFHARGGHQQTTRSRSAAWRRQPIGAVWRGLVIGEKS